ncbi:hypothetical protein TRVA0_009S01354 [Trichomonascus vanleenenianus]|uniref:uncharacterized protein n=1 Tax=Trichomonascus vanleenenianus TaxID=2268995 RepID=UPI003ECAC7FE
MSKAPLSRSATLEENVALMRHTMQSDLSESIEPNSESYSDCSYSADEEQEEIALLKNRIRKLDKALIKKQEQLNDTAGLCEKIFKAYQHVLLDQKAPEERNLISSSRGIIVETTRNTEGKKRKYPLRSTETTTPSAKGRPGRPRKIHSGSDRSEEPEKVKKRRGRPPKLREITEEPDKSTGPSKRGRPPKRLSQPTLVEEDEQE